MKYIPTISATRKRSSIMPAISIVLKKKKKQKPNVRRLGNIVSICPLKRPVAPRTPVAMGSILRRKKRLSPNPRKARQRQTAPSEQAYVAYLAFLDCVRLSFI